MVVDMQRLRGFSAGMAEVLRTAFREAEAVKNTITMRAKMTSARWCLRQHSGRRRGD